MVWPGDGGHTSNDHSVLWFWEKNSRKWAWLCLDVIPESFIPIPVHSPCPLASGITTIILFSFFYFLFFFLVLVLPQVTCLFLPHFTSYEGEIATFSISLAYLFMDLNVGWKFIKQNTLWDDNNEKMWGSLQPCVVGSGGQHQIFDSHPSNLASPRV